MLEARNLTKAFTSARAVTDLSFEVKKGEAVGFLGPNGAGKTTTFRMLAGTLGPTSGDVVVLGTQLREDPIVAKRAVGYMPEVAPLYPEMTVREYLSYRAELRAIPNKARKQAVELSAERAKVQDHLGVLIGHLSKGYRRRVALSDALIGDPPILLLDEPTAGLDPNQVLAFRELIVSLAPDHAILVSTHVLSEVEATCSRAIVINEGELVAEGSLRELSERRTAQKAKVLLSSFSEDLKKALSLALGEAVLSWKKEGEQVVVHLDIGASDILSRAIEICVKSGGVVVEASPMRAPLDQIFAQLTRRGEASS